jgi:hypothetical protein
MNTGQLAALKCIKIWSANYRQLRTLLRGDYKVPYDPNNSVMNMPAPSRWLCPC